MPPRRLEMANGDIVPFAKVDGRLSTSAPCALHVEHLPSTHVNEIHHIWPRGDGGPNVAANRIVICATGHNNIHALLNEYRIAGGRPRYSIARRFTKSERELAQLGWERMQRGAM